MIHSQQAPLRTYAILPMSLSRATGDPAGPRRRRLNEEAARLARRLAVAEAVARRCEEEPRGLPGSHAFALRLRVLRRAAELRTRFLQAVDSLVLAGGYDEARRLLAHPGQEAAGSPRGRLWGGRKG